MQEKLKKRFPQYGTTNELNSFGNYLNPCCKGVHLKLVEKFEETKDSLELRLKEWKKDEAEDVIEEQEDSCRATTKALSHRNVEETNETEGDCDV